MNRIAYFFWGVASAVGVLLSCSDDSPTDADAAACDCPASEKPITQSRIVRSNGNVATVGTSGGISAAQCPDGGIVLTGGCYEINDPFGSSLMLGASGPAPGGVSEVATGWRCVYERNASGMDATAQAQVVCLMPAP
jgi:hypothetical protein